MNYLNPHTHKLDEDVERTEATGSVLYEVARERGRQDAKWGEQNHPDGTGPDLRWQLPSGKYAPESAEYAKKTCQWAANEGRCTWMLILREEIAEAFAESDPAKLRAELIQVAAVATQWVEAIDRRSATGQGACDCESYGCRGECCGVGNCTCTTLTEGGTR